MYSEWISINDKLPDTDDYVLVSAVDLINSRLRYVPAVAMWNGYYNKWSNLDHDNYEKYLNVKVTHWMRLPKNPL